MRVRLTSSSYYLRATYRIPPFISGKIIPTQSYFTSLYSSLRNSFDSGFESTNGKDQWYVALAPYYAYGIREIRERQAWKTLTNALYYLRQKAGPDAK